MDWNDVKYFVALARTGSLSAAARHLKVDHSTIARRIAVLEDALGVRLFDRLPRGYALTPEGEHLVEQARRLEDEVFALERLARGSTGALTGTVHITAPPAFAGHFLAPRLGPLRTRHPGIALELSGDNRAADLARREADLALRLMPPEGEALIVRRLAVIGFGLFATPAYAAERPRESWDYLGYEESLDHVPQQQWLRRRIGNRPLAFRSNDLTALLMAVRGGLGVAVLPFFLEPGRVGLVRLDDDGGIPTRDLWLVVHPDLRRSPRVRAVMDHVGAAIETNRAMLVGADADSAGTADLPG